MGGPNDHWYTDLFSWNRSAFGEPIDSLVRDIRRFGGGALLRDDQPLGRQLTRSWPLSGVLDQQAARALAADLVPIRDRLAREARAAGWDVEQS